MSRSPRVEGRNTSKLRPKDSFHHSPHTPSIFDVIWVTEFVFRVTLVLIMSYASQPTPHYAGNYSSLC